MKSIAPRTSPLGRPTRPLPRLPPISNGSWTRTKRVRRSSPYKGKSGREDISRASSKGRFTPTSRPPLNVGTAKDVVSPSSRREAFSPKGCSSERAIAATSRGGSTPTSIRRRVPRSIPEATKGLPRRFASPPKLFSSSQMLKESSMPPKAPTCSRRFASALQPDPLLVGIE
jgi:hypothetical protein